ncbi:MAG: hypothetical protein ACI9TP_002283 [Candidatus Azotimanducaceae bacterium]|jgi:hypothetical protein
MSLKRMSRKWMYTRQHINRAILLSIIFSPGWVMADGMFDTDAPLKIALAADFIGMGEARDKALNYPGTLTTDTLANPIALPVELSLRGASRLKTSNCRYPPLRVDFKKSEQKAATPFAGEGDMKLVVQCGNGSKYVDYLRTEFLIYKLLNKITPLSYRVRWVEIAYSESGGSEINVRPGFFVERKKNLARRNNLKPANEVVEIFHSQLDASQAALLEHFQFLIGNTDYSLVQSNDPGECCHNAKLLRVKDANEQMPYTPIIYDFDSTGLVNTAYSAPAASLGIKRVAQRLYRGACRDSAIMENARSILLQHQAALTDLIKTDPLLQGGKKKRVVNYLKRGFDAFALEKRYQRFILGKCL